MTRLTRYLTAVIVVLGLAAFAVIPAAATVGQVFAERSRANTEHAATDGAEVVPAVTGGMVHTPAAASVAEAATTPESASVPWEAATKQTAPLAHIAIVVDCNGTVGTTNGAPATSSPNGHATGTTDADLALFAQEFNRIRCANGLDPIPAAQFRYDGCLEQRLFWMAESPSPDPLDAWGHMGSTRIDGVPSVGCDGNLAGGTNNTGATVATKWWESASHRAALYRPGASVTGVCILLAVTHGGHGDQPTFTRAAAVWRTC